MDTWAEFFAEKRLKSVMRRCEERNGGRDEEVCELVDVVVRDVVPRLLGDEYEYEYDDNDNDDGGGGGRKWKEGKKKEKKRKKRREIMPVVVHGDLWAGNKCHARIEGRVLEEVVFDPSASYAHSEYEWGIMKLFGGFDDDGEFERDYWGKVKKLEPVEEFDDRVELYALYHQLNHYAIFGRGYGAGAVRIMKRLVEKYGKG